MSKWIGLKPFLLPNSYDYVESLLNKYPIFLKISKERKSKLGDYRWPMSQDQRHEITVNGNLNPTQFLMTFIHEFAHLEVFVAYKNSVAPHGREWKHTFTELMKPLLNSNVFPQPILPHLIHHFKNPIASSMRDIRLQNAIRSYYNNHLDEENKVTTVQDLAIGTHFTLDNKRIFVKGKMSRKRYLCQEINSKQFYKVHPFAEVLQVYKNE